MTAAKLEIRLKKTKETKKGVCGGEKSVLSIMDPSPWVSEDRENSSSAPPLLPILLSHHYADTQLRD